MKKCVVECIEGHYHPLSSLSLSLSYRFTDQCELKNARKSVPNKRM